MAIPTAGAGDELLTLKVLLCMESGNFGPRCYWTCLSLPALPLTPPLRESLPGPPLAAHAHAFPDHWNGVLSVDDVCYGFYETDPLPLRHRLHHQVRHPNHASAGLEPLRHDRAGGPGVVSLPGRWPARDVRAFVDGRRMPLRVARGTARFTLRADGGKPAAGAIVRG
jgi:hypothetical protein